MTKIIDLEKYRTKTAEQRAFGPWSKRFQESFTRDTRLSDLSDKTLYFLAQPGEESAFAFYEFIMAVLDLGPAAKFSWLEKKKQLQIVDIHLFIADQVRFEMMRRLGWVDPLYCDRYTLIEMVLEFDKVTSECQKNPPELAVSYPERDKYLALTERDREGFVRRLLPEALEAFRKIVRK